MPRHGRKHASKVFIRCSTVLGGYGTCYNWIFFLFTTTPCMNLIKKKTTKRPSDSNGLDISLY